MRGSKKHSRECAATPRYGRYKYDDTEKIKKACVTEDDAKELCSLVRTELRKLEKHATAPQMDARNACASFEAALKELLHPSKAVTPNAPPTLKELIRAAVNDEFVGQNLPTGVKVKSMARFLSHVQANVAGLLFEEYDIKSEADMRTGYYETEKDVALVTNNIHKHAGTLVASFATSSKRFVCGDERPEAVTKVFEAAVQTWVPEIWRGIWNTVTPSNVFSLPSTGF